MFCSPKVLISEYQHHGQYFLVSLDFVVLCCNWVCLDHIVECKKNDHQQNFKRRNNIKSETNSGHLISTNDCNSTTFLGHWQKQRSCHRKIDEKQMRTARTRKIVGVTFEDKIFWHYCILIVIQCICYFQLHLSYSVPQLLLSAFNHLT